MGNIKIDADEAAESNFPSTPAGSVSHVCPPPGSEREVVCKAICICKDVAPSPKGGIKGKQWCVSKMLWELDKACNFKSTIKAEVPYDMSQTPPSPYMSKWEPRPTHRRPADSAIPDVVVVNNGSLPPVQGNIREIFEIKFPPDSWGDQQEKDYKEIAGTAPVTELSPEECGCGDKQKQKQPVTVPAPEEKKSTNWWAVGGVAAGVALVGGAILFPEIELPALALRLLWGAGAAAGAAAPVATPALQF